MAPAGASAPSFQYGTGRKGKGVDEEGRRELRQPRGLRVLPDGSLIVVDYGNHCVLKFEAGDDPYGTVIAGEQGKMLPSVDPLKDIDRPLGPAEGTGRLLRQPIDACLDDSGGLFVLDTHENKIQRFDLGDRAALSQVVMAPSKSISVPEAIKMPRTFSREEDGSLVVCDTWSHRVLRYPPPTPREAPKPPELLAGKANSTGTAAHMLAFPSSAVFVEGGSALLVADTNNHRVQRFELKGEHEGDLPGTTVAGSSSCESGEALDRLCMPTGLCVEPDGSFLVADRGNSRVLRFRPGSREGSVVVGPELVASPWAVARGADGELFVSDERAAAVLRFDPPGLPRKKPAAKAKAFNPPARRPAGDAGAKAKAKAAANEPPAPVSESPAAPAAAPPKMEWSPDASEMD